MRSDAWRAVLAGTALVAISLGANVAKAADTPPPPPPPAPRVEIALAAPQRAAVPAAAGAPDRPAPAAPASPRGFDVTLDFE